MSRHAGFEPFFTMLPLLRFFSRPGPLVLALAFCTFIPVGSAIVLVFQIPSGTYPEDSARLAVAPISWFAHALTGAAFGIVGPLQFVLAVRRRFGLLHRVSGWIFVLSGATVGLSGLLLLAQVTPQSTPLIDIARSVFGLALLVALALAMAAIQKRDVLRHRAWAIRAYAIGSGAGAVALVYFPIYIITGQAPSGLAADIVVVICWVLTIAFAEFVVRRSSLPSPGFPK